MVNNLTGLGTANRIISAKGKIAEEAKQEQAAAEQPQVQSYSSENIRAYQARGLNTTLSSEASRQKYGELSSKLEPETRVKLNKLLKSGLLLNNDSNDGSTVLDNLHKIVTEPRIKGLNSSKIAAEAIDEITNPGIITQTFGDIPENVAAAVLRHPEFGINSEAELDVGQYSSSCVATSIEYNLAQKHPAEFVRMAAGLSSENYSVTKDLPVSTVAENKEDAIWLFNQFNVPFEQGKNDTVKVKIQPDRNAIVRARVQTSYRDEGERSVVDVLMQSALMNLGSQHTYNALNDRRQPGLFNPENAGLSEFEKNFTEEIATGQKRVAVTYQILDENGKITGYNCDMMTMANQFINALQTGENIIVGIVDTNDEGQIINGHEITITDAMTTPNGDLVFACNDTGDGSDEPMYVLAQNLFGKVHHAGLPEEAVGDMEVPKVSDWVEYFKQYAGA